MSERHGFGLGGENDDGDAVLMHKSGCWTVLYLPPSSSLSWLSPARWTISGARYQARGASSN